VLRLVLPKGSLEESTLQLFADADLKVNRSSAVDYRASIRDDRVADVTILRPQEIPLYVAQGIYDLGITGRDWVDECAADVVSLGELPYSKTPGVDSIRIVLAVADASPCKRIGDLAEGDRPLRVATEYPELARRALAAAGVDALISRSHGATEAKVPDIADCVVELTETGRALRAAGLRIIHTLLVSFTELIANPASAADPEKRRAMDQIATLLVGTLEAREKVLVKLNVSAERRAAVLERLPSLRAPTVSELAGDGGYAIETVVRKDEINTLIPELKELGASDILELALAKIVH
jgi:ATP phosphoribosyltransferase